MGKSLDDVMAALPVDRQESIRARGAELVAEEMTLRELRKAVGTTQAELASRMGKPQAAISRMEAQSDMLMSTLNRMIESLGGRIFILAELPGRAPVRLFGLGDLVPGAEAPGGMATPREISASSAKAMRAGKGGGFAADSGKTSRAKAARAGKSA